MLKLRVTPAEGNTFILRGYQALDRKMANRKAGEIVRAGEVAKGESTIKVTAVHVIDTGQRS